MYQDIPGEDKRTLQLQGRGRRATWARPEEGEVFVFPRYNWWNNIVRIASIDREKRTITLAGDCSYADPPRRPLLRAEALRGTRRAGRMVSGPAGWTLYFWPPAPLEGKAGLSPRRLRTILEIGPGASRRHLPRLHHRMLRGQRPSCSTEHDRLPHRRQHHPQRRRLQRLGRGDQRRPAQRRGRATTSTRSAATASRSAAATA